MTYSFESFPEVLSQYVNEPIDHSCQFIVAKNGSVCGVAGVNFNKEAYPRFEHIIIHPKYQKTSLGGRLMFKVEEMIRNRGFWHYVSFIYHGNPMHHYAIKFGMRPFQNRPKGVWYYKSIQGG